MPESAADNYNKVLQWLILSNRNIFFTILEGGIGDSQKEENRGELAVFLFG